MKKMKEIKRLEEKVLVIEDREMELERLIKRVEEKIIEKTKLYVNELIEQNIFSLNRKKTSDTSSLFIRASKKSFAERLKPIDERNSEINFDEETKYQSYDNKDYSKKKSEENKEGGKKSANKIKSQEKEDTGSNVPMQDKETIKSNRKLIQNKLDTKIQELNTIQTPQTNKEQSNEEEILISDDKDSSAPIKKVRKKIRSTMGKDSEVTNQRKVSSKSTENEQVESLIRREYTDIKYQTSPTIDESELIHKGFMRKETENNIEYVNK